MKANSTRAAASSVLADFIVRSPGVAGHVSVLRPTPGESRAQTLDSVALSNALEVHETDVTYVLELRDVTEQPTDAAVTSRSSASVHNGIEIQLPSDGPGFGQVLLVTDENGIASWHWPTVD